MTVWLYMYLSDCLSIFLCLAILFQPRFQSDYLAPSLTVLSKRSTIHTNVFTHKHTELPTSSLCCNQQPSLAIVMGSFHFRSATARHTLLGHITIQQKQDKNSSNWLVASWHSPLGLQELRKYKCTCCLCVAQ